MKTALEKLFGFDSAKHSVRTEIMAGITSFLLTKTMLSLHTSKRRYSQNVRKIIPLAIRDWAGSTTPRFFLKNITS